jgi:hypothetical protein
MAERGSAQEVCINAATAAAKGIPSSGNSEKGAIAQLMALKGSHLTIAESSTSSTSYSWLVTIARSHGLTVGTGGTANDINVTTVGSVPAEIAAQASGKVDGFGGIPPNTVQNGTIVIPLWRIPPALNSAGQYLTTVTTMIQQHADTVQALVTGYMQGSMYLNAHPAGAEKIFASLWATTAGGGITSPEQQEYLFSDFAPLLKNPYPSKASYANALALVNGAQTSPITLAYSTFMAPRFIQTAGKQLNIKLK